jgi:hypothetical protein
VQEAQSEAAAESAVKHILKLLLRVQEAQSEAAAESAVKHILKLLLRVQRSLKLLLRVW